jgi:hypothetical protein
VVDSDQYDKNLPLYNQKTKPAQLFTSYTTPYVLNQDNDVSIEYSYTMFSAETATSALNIAKSTKEEKLDSKSKSRFRDWRTGNAY